MLGNSFVGDCVPAAAAHQLQQSTTYANKPYVMTEDEAVALYKLWSNYDGTPETDQGTVMVDAMQKWYTDGIPLRTGGVDKIEGFAYVHHQSSFWLRTAIKRFGSVLLGFNCPERWAAIGMYLYALEQGDLTSIAGGHCWLAVGCEDTARGTEYDVITWGSRGRVLENDLLQLTDEAFCVLNDNWLVGGVDPLGLDMQSARLAMRGLQLG